jgi:hypothetical protein
VPEPQAVIDLQAAATALGRGDLQYNPFTELCSNKTITWAFTQVKEWLDANPDDVAELFLDNRVATWNADLIANAAASVFGTMLLTPPILRAKFNGSFPSRDAMLAAGTRVIIESNDYVDNDYNKTTLPNFIFWPTTVRFNAHNAAPACCAARCDPNTMPHDPKPTVDGPDWRARRRAVPELHHPRLIHLVRPRAAAAPRQRRLAIRRRVW